MLLLPLRDINPTRRLPYVTYGLIVLNLAVFAFQLLKLSPAENLLLVRRHGVIPLFLFSGYGPSLSTLFTSMFLHDGFLHLLPNMWFLHIFGDNVEEAMGHLRYGLFYLTTGIVAALVQALMNPDSQVAIIGASGAIFGVIGGYLLLFPRARVVTLWLVFLVEVRAIFFILAYFGWNLYQGFSEYGNTRGAGVAFFAHIGGFIAGVLWLWIFGKPKLEPQVYLGERIATRNLRRRA